MSSQPVRFVPTIKLKQYDVVNEKGQTWGKCRLSGRYARRFNCVRPGCIRGFLGISESVCHTMGCFEMHPATMKFILDMPESVLKNAPGMDKDKWLAEMEKWQEEKDLELLDRYYTTYGYESYME